MYQSLGSLLQKAAQTLADTLESPAEGLLPRLRRALFWYAVLPQLLLRDVRGKKKLRKANEISERCGLFLEGRYGELLQSWRTDRNKVLSKIKRSERPDTEILRLEQAIKKIQRNEPRTAFPKQSTWFWDMVRLGATILRP